MSTDANKGLVRRLVDEIFVQGRPEAVDELIAPDFVSHTWGINDDSRAQLKAVTERVHAGLRDVEFEIEDLVAEDDRVAVRLAARATVIGEFMGVRANGKRYEIGEIHIFRIRDGQVAEHWHQHDRLGMMQQLGATSSP
jgi:steroid delta-isomerase-like uncharacterized protein